MGISSNESLISSSLVAIVGLLILTYVVSYARWQARSHGRPLPPGPKCLPLVGNIFHMRKPELWKAHRELCKTYGDIVYVPVLGQSIVILGGPQSIFDLLDKRSAVTSDRQRSVLIPLSGQDFNIAFMPYGSWWRHHRREFTHHFLPVVNAGHLEAQRQSSLLFLRKLLKDPARLCDHIRYTFSASIVKVTYGIDVAEHDDPNIALMEKTLEGFQAFSPGRFLVQYLPILQHVPTWWPIVGSQLQELKSWRTAAREVKQAMYSKTQESLLHGEGTESVLSGLLDKLGENGRAVSLEEQEIAKNVCITAFEGAADTAFSTLQFFFQAMSLYPEAQKKAQAELDIVVGPDRLPDHSDKAALPYVNALLKETLRWQNVVPMSLPHYTTEDIEYRGYFIPKGTILSPQTWACTHDPEAYPEPERFLPDRYLHQGQLNADVRDPTDFVFGYGRRVCPGKYFAETALFINVAMILHVFDITPPLDEHGNAVVVEPKLAGSFLLYPEDCRCTIKPRSPLAASLILGGH
ncbi:cytochrome P450 [Lentinus tigrinus ALCF2SS1-7]|uniref:Cytochrome P450 n=1 Tax=Lentinus tigrinus ALCF2SS1-6 TaxID=1328759 RepID=A0A5C2SHH0_9APHY|nr:cytochrome P450 [Lentinus tigrinus ALCF2SS1-6]RPD77554.1 cytochrome P450 [Lentinus tigrinus ALCF2SS1-7]